MNKVKIGMYVLHIRDNRHIRKGQLWLSTEEGEGMELNENLKRELEKLIHKFYEKHF